MKHAQLYVDIQNMRFKNSIQTHWSLDKEAEKCLIIKIILQPLIENAIIHGIFEKPSKHGTLHVCAKRNNDAITITISDDGVGMNDEEVFANFHSSTERVADTSGGYGRS